MRIDDEKIVGVLKRIGDDLYPNQTVMVNAAALRAALLDLFDLRAAARGVIDAQGMFFKYGPPWDQEGNKHVDALRKAIGAEVK